MSNKKFILNADDFGISQAFNRAILEGYSAGILKSASLMPNGSAFDEACDRIIPSCPDLGVGIHLNIIDGNALCNDLETLTDQNGIFNNSYLQLFLKSLNTKDNTFIEQVEQEFRVQIEKVLRKTSVTHIDSHLHVHAIPKIFELVCKLAKEYGIKQVRTHFEKPYIIPDVYKHLTSKYPINLTNALMLNILTLFNENTIDKYGLNTNDNLIGVIYLTMMNSLAISYGLMAINYDKVTVEAIIHPCRYEEGLIDNYFGEFQITRNNKLKSKIEQLGFEITNYKELYS